MKMGSVIIVLTMLMAGCHTAVGPTTKVETITANLDPNLTRTYTWPETGLRITLLQGWRRDDDGSDKAERSWTMLDNSNFKVRVSTAVSPRTIEDDTTHYYESQDGSEDLKYVNVDGVRGVHYLRNEKDVGLNPQDEKWIFWSGQRMWGDQRQLINIVLTTPAQSFERNRDLLYSLLASVKFDSNKSTAAAHEIPATDESVVIVVIPAEDEFYLGLHRIDRVQISGEVDKKLRDRPIDKQSWWVKASPTVSCETILRLRDDIADLGYERVGLIADKDTTKQTTSTRGQTGGPELSKSTNGETNSEAQSRFDIYVGLSKTGTPIIKVNETEVPANELSDRTRAFLQSHPDTAVIISVAPAVSYGALTGIVDSLKAGGVERMGIELGQR